jgi:acetyl-CoA acetyltransferase
MNGLKELRGSAAIAGVATFGCGEAPGFTDMELLARSARSAVADAGLEMSDIDGLCAASAGAAMWTLPVVEYLGINPRYIDGTMLGGSSFIAHLLPAMQAIRSGQCSAVLVCYGSAQRTSTLGRREIGLARRHLDPQPYEHPPWAGARSGWPGATSTRSPTSIPMSRCFRSPRMHSPHRATCTSSARRASTWPTWPWRRAPGRG